MKDEVAECSVTTKVGTGWFEISYLRFQIFLMPLLLRNSSFIFTFQLLLKSTFFVHYSSFKLKLFCYDFLEYSRVVTRFTFYALNMRNGELRGLGHWVIPMLIGIVSKWPDLYFFKLYFQQLILILRPNRSCNMINFINIFFQQKKAAAYIQRLLD